MKIRCDKGERVLRNVDEDLPGIVSFVVLRDGPVLAINSRYQPDGTPQRAIRSGGVSLATIGTRQGAGDSPEDDGTTPIAVDDAIAACDEEAAVSLFSVACGAFMARANDLIPFGAFEDLHDWLDLLVEIRSEIAKQKLGRG